MIRMREVTFDSVNFKYMGTLVNLKYYGESAVSVLNRVADDNRSFFCKRIQEVSSPHQESKTSLLTEPSMEAGQVFSEF